MLHKRQLAVAGGTLALGAIVVAGARDISGDAGYGGVGPNFLPWVVGLALLACGIGLAREAVSTGFREMEEPSGAARGDWVGFLWVSAALLVNAALITRIGFVLSCTLCFMLAVRGFRLSQGRSGWGLGGWLRDAAVGLAISAPVFWMFGKGLGISLPALTGSGWI